MASVFALFGVFTAQPAGAADCTPVAVVDGPVEIVRAIRSLLRDDGVASDPGSCPDRVVHAALRPTLGSRRYALHIVDLFGRASDREVPDAATAATLIETWAVPAVAVPVPARSSSPAPTTDRSALRVAVPAPAPAPPWRLAGAMELSGGTDGSLWYGGTIMGCLDVGGICLGGRGRAAKDDGLAGPEQAEGINLDRKTVEVLMVAALPSASGRLAFTPSMGIGTAWTHTSANAPGSETERVVGDALAVRLEAAADLGVTLGRRVALFGDVSLSLGRSVASSGPSNSGAFSMVPPAGYLRIGIGCQYAP